MTCSDYAAVDAVHLVNHEMQILPITLMHFVWTTAAG